MKITCLFWNLHKSATTVTPLVEITLESDVDIIFLCEFPNEHELQFEESLKTIDCDFHLVRYYRGNTKFRVYSRLPETVLYVVQEDNSFSLFEVRQEHVYLMCVCHLSSQLHADNNDKIGEATNFSLRLRRIEEDRDNHDLIIVGDFNEDPYHDGMLLCNGLNAVKEVSLAKRLCRCKDQIDYPYFYNPMWSLWDNNKDIGTYYYYPSHYKSEAWHIFDQVIFRPHLLDRFRHDKLQIVTRSLSTDLLASNGEIDTRYSDHLPIVFEFNV